MTTGTEMAVTTQVYRVYIKATPEAIWDAITKREWSERYGYGGRVEYDLRPGGAYRVLASAEMKRARAEMGGAPTPDVIVDGEVVESDPPRKLVQTWRMLMDPQTEAEGFTRLTYEIAETGPGVSKLTVTHDLEGAPRLALFVGGGMESDGAGGGWSEVFSDLKTLLETGRGMRE
ncbi:MAG TPA: SRPBCC family protein [Actinomycetota bacterium]|nr:SRPBCC family protein [Actinomycetota bacterium]